MAIQFSCLQRVIVFYLRFHVRVCSVTIGRRVCSVLLLPFREKPTVWRTIRPKSGASSALLSMAIRFVLSVHRIYPLCAISAFCLVGRVAHGSRLPKPVRQDEKIDLDSII